MPTKFVYFDLGGVVFHFREGLTKLAMKHNLAYSDFERVWREYDAQVCRGEMTADQLWNVYQKELNFSEDMDFLEYWVTYFAPIVETHSLMVELVARDIPIGLLTNIYLGAFELMLSKGAIPNLAYTSVVQSCKVGLIKPENEIYALAQEQAGCLPNNILFIDDRWDFLEPAKKLGWNTVHFETNDIGKSIAILKKYLRDFS